MDNPDPSTLYTFSASAPRQPEGEVTYLYYSAPVAPDVVLDALPTISRRFFPDGVNIKSENHNEGVDVEDGEGSPPPEPLRQARNFFRSPFSASRSATPTTRVARSGSAVSTTSFASPPPPSRSVSIATSEEETVHSSAPSSGARQPPCIRTATPAESSTSGPPHDWENYLPPRVVTRSQSRSSLRGVSNDHGIGPSNAPTSTVRNSPGPSGTGSSTTAPSSTARSGAILSASGSSVGNFGISAFLAKLHYAPTAPVIEVRYRRQKRPCQKTREEQDKGLAYKTYWYECWGNEPIAAPPPEMSDHRELEVGHIFCYWTPESFDPTMWLWTFGRNGRPHWLPVTQGHLRVEDDRKLSLSEGHKPSWAKDDWYRKRLLQQEHERRQTERANRKGKGKAM